MSSAGSLEVAQWLYENRAEGCVSPALNGAARRGVFELVLFFHNTYSIECTEHTVVEAAKSNCLELLQWFFVHYPERVNVDAMPREYKGRALPYMIGLAEQFRAHQAQRSS